MNYHLICPYCGNKLLDIKDGKSEVTCIHCGEKFIIEIKDNSLNINLVQKSDEV